MPKLSLVKAMLPPGARDRLEVFIGAFGFDEEKLRMSSAGQPGSNFHIDHDDVGINIGYIDRGITCIHLANPNWDREYEKARTFRELSRDPESMWGQKGQWFPVLEWHDGDGMWKPTTRICPDPEEWFSGMLKRYGYKSKEESKSSTGDPAQSVTKS